MQQRDQLNRREILQLGMLGGAALGVSLVNRQAHADTGAPQDKRQPKNIIFMVADGMSAGALSLADPFSQMMRGTGTNWRRLLTDTPEAVHGLFETYSLNSLVTDSAAASSAWASGTRVCNGAVNVLPDGTKLTPITPLALDAGFRVGLVTTTTITHATPAGFAAVVPIRDDQETIAQQYLDHVDVLMGGGEEFFDPHRRGDKLDLWARYRERGYAVWRKRAEVTGSQATPRKILGVFDRGHLPYSLDWVHDPQLQEQVPTLAEMTRTALRALNNGGKRFLLQVEGGRVDHAAHENDAAGVLWDQVAFDDALGVVLEFVSSNPETLVVITTDHGNANPGLNGTGTRYVDTNTCFERLGKATSTLNRLRSRLRRRARDDAGLSVDDATDLIHEATGITLAKDEAEAVQAAAMGRPPHDLSRQHRNFEGTLGQVLSNHHGVAWTGVSHTSDLVMLTAMGPGSAQFSGLLRNTDAFGRLTALMDIRHHNPALAPDQARTWFGKSTTRAASLYEA